MDGLHRHHRAGRGGGFTLIELLVVISIIALLISLLLPSLGAAKMQAAKTKAAAQIKGIGTMMHTYAADNNNYFPYEPPQNPGDLTNGLPGAGSSIWGMQIKSNFERGYGYGHANAIYGPQGLGALPYPGQYAADGNLQPGVTYGSYMPPEFLYSPESLASRRNHPNNNWNGTVVDPIGYFGYKGKSVFNGTTLPLNPGNYWWEGGAGGNYYMSSSYSYRSGHRGKWSGKTGWVESDHHAQWTVDGVITTQDVAWNYLQESHPKNNGVSIVAEVGGHWEHNAKLLGGNYILTDGSGHWFANEDYGKGWYHRGSGGSPGPLGNTCSGWYGDAHHGIHQNLIFAAIDRHRSGLKVPGSDGVSGYTYAGD